VATVDAPPDLIITVTDARRAGYCVRGIKEWFDHHPALNFRTFLRVGIPAGEALEHGDAHVARVVAKKLGR